MDRDPKKQKLFSDSSDSSSDEDIDKAPTSDEDIDKAPTRLNSIYPSGEWSRECRRYGGRGIKHGYGPLRYEDDDDDDEEEEEEDEVSGIGGPIKNQDSSSVDEAPSLFPSREWSRVCRRYGGRGISYGSGPLRYEDDDDVDEEEEEVSGIGGPIKNQETEIKNQETESIIKKTRRRCDNKGGKLKAMVVNVDGGDTDATLLQVDEASSSVGLGEQSDAAGAGDNKGGKTLAVTTTTTTTVLQDDNGKTIGGR